MKRWTAGFAALACLLLAGCAREPSESRISFPAMNTYMTFTACGERAQDALEAAKKLTLELEEKWSTTDARSEIYAANHSGGVPVPLSEESAAIVAFALEMAESTGGALDPTIYPLLTAWGFTTESKQVPSAEQIAERLARVDYSKIRLDGARLSVPEGMQLDLGAVGKGYAADLIARRLEKSGVESALLNLGGNVQAVGSRPDGGDWRIGIRAPWEDGMLGVLEISDAAVVTSGGYENYFVDAAGERYWHILDPESGRPARSGLQSVVIVGSEGKLCDALSTALFVMGAEAAEAYWRANGGFDMLLLTDGGEILLTEGLAGRFSLGEGRTESLRVLRA